MKIDWPNEIKHVIAMLERSPPSVENAIDHLKKIQHQNDMLHGANRVLILDDNTDILELLEEVLHSKGFEVFPSTHGDETLDILSGKPQYFFHAVILDLVIVGGRGGLSVLSEIQSARPEISIILSSGHPTEFALLRDNATFTLLHKPYRIDDVLQILNDACTSSRQRYYKLG